MADLDDDDHAELLVANSGRHYSGRPGASYIYRGGPSGPILEDRLEVPAQEVGSWSVADLNRDGFLDALACDFDSLAIAWGSAAGVSTDPQRVEGVAKASQNCRLIDFNGDGWLDVLVADVQGARSRVLLGDGQGLFAGSVSLGGGGFCRQQRVCRSGPGRVAGYDALPVVQLLGPQRFLDQDLSGWPRWIRADAPSRVPHLRRFRPGRRRSRSRRRPGHCGLTIRFPGSAQSARLPLLEPGWRAIFFRETDGSAGGKLFRIAGRGFR